MKLRRHSVAAALNGMDRQTLSDWRHRYNAKGIDGLKSRKSPGREPSPMETVWNYPRQNKRCALVWDGHEAIIDACKAAWNWSMADPAGITSIGTGEWTRVSL